MNLYVKPASFSLSKFVKTAVGVNNESAASLMLATVLTVETFPVSSSNNFFKEKQREVPIRPEVSAQNSIPGRSYILDGLFSPPSLNPYPWKEGEVG